MKIDFKKIKIKSAKLSDLKSATRLFKTINKKVAEKDVREWIKEKKVFVLKDKKKIKAAFSYTVYGAVGIFALIYVHKIAVDPSLRGNGMGSFILNEIRRKSVKIGVAGFFLYSVKKAEKFYTKHKLARLWRFFWWKSPTIN